MEKRRKATAQAFGGTSLLVMFSVLCLAVFAVLSLGTVRAETRLTEASAEAISAYYEADCRAEEIFARLRGGETVPEVSVSGDIYAYSCPISESQTLCVELQSVTDGWTVIRWQAVPIEAGESGGGPSVWDGETIA